MRRVLIHSSIGIALLLLILPSAYPHPAQAQSPPQSGALNVEISPLPIQLSAKPGTAVSTDLRVRNSGATPETLKATLKTFSAEGANGQIVLHDPTPADNFTSWVSFSKTQFNAPPGLWQTIKMTVNLPKTADYGYYYAVQFQLANPPKAQPGATSVQGAVVIFVLLNAQAPGETRQVSVSDFSADHQSYEFLPANFTIRIHNSGNIHTSAFGNLFIKRGGKQIASIPINASQGLVLPHSNRVFSASWNNGFPVYTKLSDASGQPLRDAKGNVKQKLSWNFSQISKLRFGHYTAQLVLIYNNGQRDVPITGTLSFWVVPWRLLIGVIVVIAGPALLVYLIMRRRFNKRLEKEKRRINHAG